VKSDINPSGPIGTSEGRERKEGVQLTDRETRTLHRRVADEFGDSSLMRYNQLTMRKKKVKFMKSSIHGWGLFDYGITNFTNIFHLCFQKFEGPKNCPFKRSVRL